MILLLIRKGEIKTITSSLPKKKKGGPCNDWLFWLRIERGHAAKATGPFPSKSNFFSIWVDKIQKN